MADNESLSSIMAKLKKKRETLEANAAETPAEAPVTAADSQENLPEESVAGSAPETGDVDGIAEAVQSTVDEIADTVTEMTQAAEEAPSELDLLMAEISGEENTSKENETSPAVDEAVTIEDNNTAAPEEAADDRSLDEILADEVKAFAGSLEEVQAEEPVMTGSLDDLLAADEPSEPAAAPAIEEQAAEVTPSGDISDDLYSALLDDIMSPSADEAGYSNEEPAGTDDDLYNSLLSEIGGEAPAEENTGAVEDDNDVTTGTVYDEAPAAKPAHADDDLLLAAFGYSKSPDGSAASDGRQQNASISGLVKKPQGGTNGVDLDGAFAYEGEEYRDRAQKGKILNAYDRERRLLWIRLGGTFLFAILLLIFDLAGKKFGGALSARTFPVVNIMISLQLLLICAAFSFKRIYQGIAGIIKTQPTPMSVTAAVVVLTVVYDILIAIAKPENGFYLYNSPAAFCLLASVLADAGELFRQTDNFKRLSSWESVCTLESAGKKNDTGVYRLNTGSFAENYFKHTNRVDPKYRVLNYVIAPVVALALIMMIITLARKDSSFQNSLNVFIVTIQFSLPTFVILADLIPFLTFCFKNVSTATVILHETDTAEYESVKSVVLDETDMFGDGSLNVTRVRICENDTDVYSVMTDTTSICGRIGGTISTAFKRIADESEDTSAEDRSIIINKVVDGGIDAYADGKHYLIGNVGFMSENGIVCRGCDDGRYTEITPRGAVLHIAVDGIESVRLYMEYTPGRSFTELIESFRGRDVKIELHCVDPNLNSEFVSAMLGGGELMIDVIRESSVPNREKGRVDGGIIADGDEWMTILETAGLCNQYRNASKLNFYIMAGFTGLGVLLSLLLGLFGASVGISSIFIIIFRILAILPSVLIARVYLK